MNSFLIANLKPLIIFVHLSGLAFGVGGAWILDLYILRKMYKSPVTKENIQIIDFVSKVIVVGLAMLWVSGLSFIAYYYLMQPESLSNHKIWAKLLMVVMLTINGYYLHQLVLPIISRNLGKVLIKTISLKEVNLFMLTGCISFITWPLAMILGTFKSINFAFSFFELITCYLVILISALVVSFILKSHLLEKEMDRKIRALNEHLEDSNKQLVLKQRDIDVLTRALK